MSELFQPEFMRFALISSSLIGLVCSWLGVYVVLRRIVFVGVALAQMSALGVAVGALLDKDPVTFAMIFTIIGVVIFAPEYGGKKIPAEAVIGIGFVASWAFTILVFSKVAHGESDMVNMIQGNILGATERDIDSLLMVLLPVSAIHILFYKQFLFVSFDSEMAGTLGVKSGLWNFIFYLTLGIVVAVSIKVAGVLLVFAFLLLPAVTALLAGKSMKLSFALAALSAVISSVTGLIISFKADLPTGPAIAGTLFVLMLLTAIIAFIIGKIRK
ncbi:MAG: metal ABC transporter permease [Firmicutes bacterium]|nr:metal ABC transporter permease [Bacillota bacterium]